MRRVFLIRHGAAFGDGGRRYLGRTDLPMSAAGIAEIDALAAAFADVGPFDAIWCSDLVRARRSAEILAVRHSTPIRVEPRLREIDMGAWEGLDHAAVAAADPDAWAARGRDILGFRAPGGESFADVRTRVLAVWETIEEHFGEASIAVVGHAGAHRLLVCHVLGMPPENLFRLAKTTGHVDLLEGRRGDWRLRLFDAGPDAVAEWGRDAGRRDGERAGDEASARGPGASVEGR
ncbi:MAG: histidine phosphatase family protein [Hyphomicrobiales bacterium]|nr:histidine phosphatase family protein [Hyphomicrobiales bacterium]